MNDDTRSQVSRASDATLSWVEGQRQRQHQVEHELQPQSQLDQLVQNDRRRENQLAIAGAPSQAPSRATKSETSTQITQSQRPRQSQTQKTNTKPNLLKQVLTKQAESLAPTSRNALVRYEQPRNIEDDDSASGTAISRGSRRSEGKPPSQAVASRRKKHSVTIHNQAALQLGQSHTFNNEFRTTPREVASQVSSRAPSQVASQASKGIYKRDDDLKDETNSQVSTSTIRYSNSRRKASRVPSQALDRAPSEAPSKVSTTRPRSQAASRATSQAPSQAPSLTPSQIVTRQSPKGAAVEKHVGEEVEDTASLVTLTPSDSISSAPERADGAVIRAASIAPSRVRSSTAPSRAPYRVPSIAPSRVPSQAGSQAIHHTRSTSRSITYDRWESVRVSSSRSAAVSTERGHSRPDLAPSIAPSHASTARTVRSALLEAEQSEADHRLARRMQEEEHEHFSAVGIEAGPLIRIVEEEDDDEEEVESIVPVARSTRASAVSSSTATASRSALRRRERALQLQRQQISSSSSSSSSASALLLSRPHRHVEPREITRWDTDAEVHDDAATDYYSYDDNDEDDGDNNTAGMFGQRITVGGLDSGSNVRVRNQTRVRRGEYGESMTESLTEICIRDDRRRDGEDISIDIGIGDRRGEQRASVGRRG